MAKPTSVVPKRRIERRGWLRRNSKSLIVAAVVLVCAAVVFGWQRLASDSKVIDSVAVLPFVNVGNDPQMEYLPDGITDSLIASLSQLPDLRRVMARETVFTYKGRAVDPRQIGKALGVRALVTGRVQRKDNLLIIRVELVDTSDGARLWGQEYRPLAVDLLKVQEEIAREISNALRPRLRGDQQKQLSSRHTASAEAYERYLKGRHLHFQFTQESQEKALAYFQQAIAIDPGYALAYAGVADVYSDFSSQYLPPGEAMTKARQAASTAIQLDDSLAEAHHSMALVKWWGDWDWAGAEREFLRAIQLNPYFPAPHIYYAGSLGQLGRFEEALQEAKKAEELDPLSAQAVNTASRIYFYAGQYDLAIAQSLKALEINANFTAAYNALARALIEKRMHQEALAKLRQAVVVNPSHFNRAWLAYGLAVTGQRAEARKILSDLEQMAARKRVSPVYLARIHIGLGNKDAALALLRKGYEEHSDHMLNLRVEPLFDSLSTDPRFIALLRGIGLATDQKAR